MRSFGVRAACCRFPARELARESDDRSTILRQQAGWAQSGSKLHALQSCAGINNLSDGGKTSIPD
jgi:hypothetical protein